MSNEDTFDASIAMLRATVGTGALNPKASKRSEICTRAAVLDDPGLAAVLDAMRRIAPDPELDRLLRRSA